MGLYMKNRVFILFLLLLVASAAKADQKSLDLELDSSSFFKDDSKDTSWMYDKNYQSSDAQFSSECEKMTKQIEALKGKPQRKSALQRRYEAECLK